MTVVAADPADALQVGMYALLAADDDLADAAGVYDNVPEDAAAPYVVIGEMTAIPDGDHDLYGRQTAATVHTWTRARSHRPGNQIAAQVVALLVGQQAILSPLVDGHDVWAVRHEFSQTLIDPEPGVRHRVDRFRIYTRQQEVSP